MAKQSIVKIDHNLTMQLQASNTIASNQVVFYHTKRKVYYFGYDDGISWHIDSDNVYTEIEIETTKEPAQPESQQQKQPIKPMKKAGKRLLEKIEQAKKQADEIKHIKELSKLYRQSNKAVRNHIKVNYRKKLTFKNNAFRKLTDDKKSYIINGLKKPLTK